MSREVKSDDTFAKICEVQGREGTFRVIRKGKKQSRVILMGGTGEGEKVDTTSLLNERDTPKPEVANGAPSTSTPASVPPASVTAGPDSD